MWRMVGGVVLLAALLAPASPASTQSVPSAPDVVARSGDQSITLVWGPVNNGGSPIVWWEFRQVLPPIDYWLQIPDSGAGTTSHTVTGLTNGTPYRFEVRAVSFAGNGRPGVSRPSSGTGGDLSVSPSTTPAQPMDLSATAGNSQVSLSWTAAQANTAADGYSPITSYEYRQQAGGGAYAPWTAIIDSNAATTGHIVTGLSNGTAYRFQVRARNANGAGAGSETEPALVATAPGAPRGLVAQAGYGTAVLSWAPASNGGAPITSWQFRQQTGSADIADAVPWATIPDSHAHTTSYTVVGLDNEDHVYRFEVRAVNEAGPGAGAATGVVDPGRVPARPLGVTATLGEGTTDTATLAWRRPDDRGSPIIGYQYSQSAGSSRYGPWQDIPDSGPHTSSHEVSDLVAGTAYRFRVRAVNAIGGGIASVATRPIYPGTAPSAPQYLRAANSYDAAKGTRQVTLSWSPGYNGGSPVTKWEYKYITGTQELSSLYDDQGWVAICDSTATRADAGCRFQRSVSLPRSASRLALLGIAGGSDGPELAPVAGETYLVVVRAVNERGNGLRSGTAGTSIPRIIPTTPSAVYFRDAAENSFRVWWPRATDGGTNANIAGTDVRLRYQLSFRVGSGPWSAWTFTNTNTATIANAMAGQRYQVRVRAENAVGVGGTATSAGYVHGGPPTPGADVVGTHPVLTVETAAGQATLSLARTANAGSVGGITAITAWEYSYRVGDGDYGNWTYNNAGLWFDDITVDSLADGEPHTFRIRGVNGQYAGPSIQSEAVIPGPAPHAPADLVATGGDGQVTLTWTSSGGGPPVTRWQVCQLTDANPCGDVDAGEGWTDIFDSGPATSSHTVEDLANGTAYTFLVRAWNAIGRGARAQANQATPGRAPDAPDLVLATARNSRAIVYVITPSEDHGDPETSYQYRTKAADGAYSAWETVSRDGTKIITTVTITGLTNGVSHAIEVRAVNDSGPGEAATLSPVTPLGPPPAGVLSAEPDNGRVVLTWTSGGDGGSPITGWQYRQKQDGGRYGEWFALPASDADNTGYTVSGLAYGIAYTFQVRAVNTLGSGEAFESTPVILAQPLPPAPSVTAVRGNGQIDLLWTVGAPGASGGADESAPITGWQYRLAAGDGDYGVWADIFGSADTSSTQRRHLQPLHHRAIQRHCLSL